MFIGRYGWNTSRAERYKRHAEELRTKSASELEEVADSGPALNDRDSEQTRRMAARILLTERRIGERIKEYLRDDVPEKRLRQLGNKTYRSSLVHAEKIIRSNAARRARKTKILERLEGRSDEELERVRQENISRYFGINKLWRDIDSIKRDAAAELLGEKDTTDTYFNI